MRNAAQQRPRCRRLLAAVGAGALVTSLAACASDSGPPVLTWYINPDNGGQARIAAECTQAAEGAYRIETALLPREASAQREQLVRRLAANDDSIALMSLDPPFIPEFAEADFLAPVPDGVAEEVTDDVVQSAIDGSTWKGELVAVPFWANTQLLWYRKSMAQEAGLDMSRPVTWDQLMEAARSLDTELGVHGIRAEALTVWINALVESAGGHILSNPEAPAKEVEAGIDSEAGRAAARIIGEIADDNLAGPALSTQNEDAARALFESGNAAFMVNWPFVWPAAKDAVEAGAMEQSVLDDYGWTTYPAVSEGERSRPPYGGISLGVGAFTPRPDLAYDAARCIVSEEHQAEYFLSDGNPPAKRGAYDHPEVQEQFPMAPAIADSLDQAAPRPQTPYYNEVSQSLQRTWHPPRSVNPDTTPQESAEFITSVLRKEDLL